MERLSTVDAIKQRQAADTSQRRFEPPTDRSRLSKSVAPAELERRGDGSRGTVRLPPINAAVSAPSRSVHDPWSHVKSKCNSLSNIGYKPGGGRREITTMGCHWHADARVGSLINIHYLPGGGNKKVETIKLLWRAAPKVGSLDNVNHVPGGGAKKIKTRRCVWHAEAKVGSLTNAQHTPGGGNVKIGRYKLKFKENALPRITFVTYGDRPSKLSGSKENVAASNQVQQVKPEMAVR